MSEALLEPQAHADRRLALAIVIAMAVHGMVVLGVRLPAEAPVKSRFAAMQVLLMAVSVPTAVPVSEPVTEPEPVSKPAPVSAPPPVSKPASVKPATPKVTLPVAPATPAAVTQTAAPPPPATPLLPSAVQLIERSMAIAATGAGLIEEKTMSGQSLAERTHYIKKNSRDFAESTFMSEVTRRIEDVAKLNERKVPPGRVVLEVSTDIDGNVLDPIITKSSGIAATDAEAIRLLGLVGQLSPMTPEETKKYDARRFELPVNFKEDTGFSHGQ